MLTHEMGRYHRSRVSLSPRDRNNEFIFSLASEPKWYTSDDTIARVLPDPDARGATIVAGDRFGTCNVWCELADGSRKAEMHVVVVEDKANELNLRACTP